MRRRALAAAGLAWSVQALAQPAGAPTYADLAPILAERCLMCHAGEAAAAGLRLDSHAAVLKGSARGAIVQPGDPAASELVRRLKGTSQPRMPMTGPPYLSDAEVALFERWIASGLAPSAPSAPDAPGASAPPVAGGPPAAPRPGEPVTYLHVAPIFAKRCAKCHTDNGQLGPPPEGYRLTSHAATLSAADRARVVPGRPEASELIRRVRGQARPRMPLNGPPFLGDDEIRLLQAWVQQGARDAAGKPTPIPAGAAVRLHGTLGAGWRLDDLPLAVTPGTRIDKRTAPGDYAELRGRIAGDGSVIVERLRAR